ncbi:RNB domain-containing ribonuclease [Acetobacter estunensis]|uniref:RNB domain-containing ribonuclease n=1 Tax=Acetobacter estunensis TaxID=104097 RepID=UPI001C2D2979|nr:RNB domain-containing ribonuclease [Acetobacter estunensis]MBV1835851.1 RNB domain-containing ribonuclease [Acetobacter estunensis]MBV1835888.1 RNB domain-containing ribonuclease [Acetobacter estunensis]
MSLDRDALLCLLRQAEEPLTPLEILRRLGLAPSAKGALKALLREMTLEGVFCDPALAGQLRGMRDLPRVAELVVTGQDRHGGLIAWFAKAPPLAGAIPPVVFLRTDAVHFVRPRLASRVLARLTSLGPGRFAGRVLRLLDADGGETIGVLRTVDGCCAPEGVDLTDPSAMEGTGSVVMRAPDGRIRRVLGTQDQPATLMLACQLEAGLPEVFPDEVLREAAACQPMDEATARKQSRLDVRELPLLTIDGVDARDFDDAVWAGEMETGLRLVVAIADVAHYVTKDSALDREARRRGHSVYLPDRVVPMLPPRLSEDLCSLRPNEGRPCVLFDLRLSAGGELEGAELRRGFMRSHARLTYERMQAVLDGKEKPPQRIPPAMIGALRAVDRALAAVEVRRGVTRCEDTQAVPQFRWENGQPIPYCDVSLASHRMIERFMVMANHAAARLMRNAPHAGLFRVHPKGQGVNPSRLPAFASPCPAPHHALALDVYTHVTSPIRRYADLLCHRSLFDGVEELEEDRAALAVHLAATEGRAACVAAVSSARLLTWCGEVAERGGHVTNATPSGSRSR